MKKMISLIVVSSLILSLFCFTAYAQQSKFAVYSKNGITFNGNGTIHQGDTIVENGTIEGLGWESRVKEGKLYYMPSVPVPNEVKDPYNTTHKNYVLPYPGVAIDFSELTLPAFPELQKKDSIDINYQNGLNAVIDENGWYPEIKIIGQTLTLETKKDEVLRIRTDRLFLEGTIQVKGKGKVIFYVDKYEGSGSNPRFNDNGSEANVAMYLSGKETSTAIQNLHGTLDIYAPTSLLSFSGGDVNLTGNIYTAKDISMQGSFQLNGYLYVPSATVTINGDSQIKGKIVCNKLNLLNGKVYQRSVNDIFDGLINDLPYTDTPPTKPGEDIPDYQPDILDFHYAYLYGYEGGLSGYDDPIQKDAAAAILYRILKQNDVLNGFVSPSTATFVDMPKGFWSFNAIEYMTHIGVYDKNVAYVHPTKMMTRAEVAKIISYSLGLKPIDDKPANFSDVSKDAPEYAYIKALYDRGYLLGDNNEGYAIRPNDHITRAEYVTIINRLIRRDSSYDISNSKIEYPDMMKDITEAWIYENITKASNGYDDEKTDGAYQINESRRLPRNEIDYN